MSKLRVLILGPDCHPDRVSIPRVTYRHAAALAKLHDVTLVVRPEVEADVRAAGAPFQAVEAVATPLLAGLFTRITNRFFKNDFNTQWRTAMAYPLAVAFEWKAWRRFRRRIRTGEFDVVIRVAPMSATLPSPFARFLRRGPIPFVVGPVNGGLPWPQGFPQLGRARERISALRGVYRHLPFAKSTYRQARAIIAASSQTCRELSIFSKNLFFIPENGVEADACDDSGGRPRADGPLEVLFTGGLLARKACDIAIKAATHLIQRGTARLTIIGDGPDRQKLEALAKSLGVADRVQFTGWLAHEEVLRRMRAADVFLFPSLRDFGGGVVFEALASGAVPVVVDFGGPGDIVNPAVGLKVPLTNASDVIARLEQALRTLAGDRELLQRLRKNGLEYARERLTWDAKARQTTQILEWVTGRAPRPQLPSPNHASAGASGPSAPSAPGGGAKSPAMASPNA